MDISAEIIAATRNTQDSEIGLITFQITVPLYIWVELLTHRSFARNASSNRAMSTKRTLDMGYYTPETFYTQGKGMQSSDTPIRYQRLARLLWHASTRLSHLGAKLLDRLGVAKEQRNRLIAPNKMIRAIVTGTEQAWRAFLILRNDSTADKAMQECARLIAQEIEDVTWVYGITHNPFPDEDIRRSVAKIARVSYDRSTGKDDVALYNSLIENRHMSPTEHIAYWVYNPRMNVFAHQKDKGCGWETYRSRIES